MSLAPFDVSRFCPFNEPDWVYTSVRNGGNVSVTLPRCAYYPDPTTEARPSGGIYTRVGGEAAFGFGELGTSGIEPKPGDTLTPPGKPPMTVTTARVLPRMLRHKVTLVGVKIDADLKDTATVLRPSAVADAFGLRVENFAAVYSNVTCAFHPSARTAEKDTAGGEKTRQTFTAYLAGALLLRAGDVIDVGGVRYEVDGQQDLGLLDALTAADVHRID